MRGGDRCKFQQTLGQRQDTEGRMSQKLFKCVFSNKVIFHVAIAAYFIDAYRFQY